jgi:lysozyme
MKLSPAGEAFIKGYEKLRLVAYKPTPDDKWTYGWGHTGPEVVEGATCTPEQAEIDFLKDTTGAVWGVMRSTDVALSQNQFDALVSFTFNVGVAAEAHSTLCQRVNARDRAGIAAEWVKWDHQNGKVVPGLLDRRRAELAMFQAASPGV